MPQLRVPQVTAGCQRTLLMAHYNFCGGPLIPAHITTQNDILQGLTSDDDLTSSNNKTKQNDRVSDEHGVREY